MASGCIIRGLRTEACQLGNVVLVGTVLLYFNDIIEVCLLFQACHSIKGIKCEIKMERLVKYERI